MNFLKSGACNMIRPSFHSNIQCEVKETKIRDIKILQPLATSQKINNAIQVRILKSLNVHWKLQSAGMIDTVQIGKWNLQSANCQGATSKKNGIFKNTLLIQVLTENLKSKKKPCI
jgi:hypothetical protein